MPAAMTKKTINTLSLLLLVLLASCEREHTTYENKVTAAKDTVSSSKTAAVVSTYTLGNTAAALWLSPKTMTPFSFLAIMKKRKEDGNTLGAVTMTDDFPNNWIRKEDIAALLKLIDSQEKCSCFLNPLSSRIPTGNATVGGYAIAFVDAYKEKRNVSFDLCACPEANKQKANALRKWWAAQKKQAH